MAMNSASLAVPANRLHPGARVLHSTVSADRLVVRHSARLPSKDMVSSTLLLSAKRPELPASRRNISTSVSPSARTGTSLQRPSGVGVGTASPAPGSASTTARAISDSPYALVPRSAATSYKISDRSRLVSSNTPAIGASPRLSPATNSSNSSNSASSSRSNYSTNCHISFCNSNSNSTHGSRVSIRTSGTPLETSMASLTAAVSAKSSVVASACTKAPPRHADKAHPLSPTQDGSPSRSQPADMASMNSASLEGHVTGLSSPLAAPLSAAAAAAAAADAVEEADGDGRRKSRTTATTAITTAMTTAMTTEVPAASRILLSQRPHMPLSPSSPSSPSSSSSSLQQQQQPNVRSSAETVGSHVLCGLSNLTNTCYMNSAIQCMLNISPWVEYFLANRHLSDLNHSAASKGKIAREFGAVVSEMHLACSSEASAGAANAALSLGRRPVVRPSALKSTFSTYSPLFSGYAQHDSQEFLRSFLDLLHDELNRVIAKPPYEELKDIDGETVRNGAIRWWKHYLARNSSLVVDLFAGQLKSTVRCRRCGKESHAFDPFLDLSLPISRQTTTLYDCLREFTAEESLGGSERPRCSQCKEATDSTRTLRIFRLPRVLVLHLKRFSNSFTKVTHSVSFPVEQPLDLADFCEMSEVAGSPSAKSIYRLNSIVSHSGSLHGGHYVACVRKQDLGDWFLVSDSSVSRVSQDDVRSSGSDVYLLVYQLVPLPLPVGP